MDLKINNKLFGFSGVIGRRNYILNVAYMCIISSFLSLPFSFWMLKNASNSIEMMNFPALLQSAPTFARFFYLLACLVCIILTFGLYCRRLSDIMGKPQNLHIYVMSAGLIAMGYSSLFGLNPITVLITFINFVLGIIIMCLVGKVSGQIPHDPIKRFNWGAFWGTWIWGLINRSYITLWAIPLFFTPAFLFFMVVCGIKGGEWAFVKTKALDVEKFQRGQKHQAIFWNIFAGFMIFIMPILIIFIMSAMAVVSTIQNPDGTKNVISKTENFIESMIEDSFVSWELDIDENKFYMDPVVWLGMDYNERYNAFRAASSFAALKKSTSEDEKFEGYSGSRSQEMSITKIYSSYNGEVLAEFNMDEDDIHDFSSAMKSAFKAFKVNTNPEIPPQTNEDNVE